MFNNNNQILNVKVNGKVVENVHEGVKVEELLDGSTKRETLAVKVNNQIHSIFYSLIDDSEIETISFYDEEGERIYARSLKFFFLMALHNLYDVKVEFTNKMGRDYFIRFYDFDVTAEVISKIKKEMKRIIKSSLQVKKVKTTFECAKKIYKNMNSSEQLDNFRIKVKENYTFYECEGYYNYLYGLIVPNSSYIKAFDLKRYKDGIVLLLPKKDDINTVTSEIQKSKIYDEFDKFKTFANRINISKVADINEHVLNSTIGDIIRFSEADHNRRLVECMSKIIKKKDVKIIFIAGPSSSGKTTFSQKLAIQLKIIGKNAIPLAMDNYFNDLEDIPLKPDGSKDYETIKNMDISLFSSQIKAMLRGETVEVPEYNFNISRKEYKGRKIKLDADDILIIEGIHALNPSVSEFIEKTNKFKIYVAPLVTLGLDNFTKVSSNDTRLIRRIVRDADSRGRDASTTLASWSNVRHGEEENIFPFASEADYVYNTSLIYELGVLKPFAENLLLRVDEKSKYYSDARRLYKLISNFRTIETTEVPLDSIVKEFVGKGCFYR